MLLLFSTFNGNSFMFYVHSNNCIKCKKKETPFEETLRDNANYDYNDLTRKCSLRKCLEVAEELYDHQHEQELDAVCV